MARGDWVPNRNWGDNLVVVAGTATNVLLVRHESVLPALAPTETSGVPEDSDDIVVERVVGQWEAITTGEDPAICLARIRVGLYDDIDDTAAFYSDDFNDGLEANEPFLWQRIVSATEISLIDPVVHPGWSMLDVRVSRKLTRDQALFFSVFAVNADAQIRVWVRSWARFSG